MANVSIDQRVFDSLRSITLGDAVTLDGVSWQDESCEMCYEKYEAGDQVKVCHDRHFFHDGCLREWFASPCSTYNCPKCRGKILAPFLAYMIGSQSKHEDWIDDDEVDFEADLIRLPGSSGFIRNEILDSWTAWEMICSERGLNWLSSGEWKWEQFFINPYGIPSHDHIRSTSYLAAGDPLEYVKHVGQHLYHRRDEYVSEELFEETSDFGRFLDRVEVAVAMLELEHAYAIDEKELLSSEQIDSICFRAHRLHQELAKCLTAESEAHRIEDGQQLLHQGFCILAAAHRGPYPDHNSVISLEAFDYSDYGGDDACHDDFLEAHSERLLRLSTIPS